MCLIFAVMILFVAQKKGQNNIYYPIMTAFLGSAPNNRVIKSFLKCYDDLSFINKEGRENLTTNVILLSKVLKEQFGIADEICGNTKINLSNDEVIFPYYYFGRLLGGHITRPLVKGIE